MESLNFAVGLRSPWSKSSSPRCRLPHKLGAVASAIANTCPFSVMTRSTWDALVDEESPRCPVGGCGRRPPIIEEVGVGKAGAVCRLRGGR